MSPHQALALGVRLFAIWFALVTVREVLGFIGTWRSWDDAQALLFLIGGSILTLGIVLALWLFPKSIARGLLPTSNDVSTQTSSYQMWFTLGTALIGLWFVASAIAPILRNLSVMYVFTSELAKSGILFLRSRTRTWFMPAIWGGRDCEVRFVGASCWHSLSLLTARWCPTLARRRCAPSSARHNADVRRRRLRCSIG
jgi:hypothetical protein